MLWKCIGLHLFLSYPFCSPYLLSYSYTPVKIFSCKLSQLGIGFCLFFFGCATFLKSCGLFWHSINNNVLVLMQNSVGALLPWQPTGDACQRGKFSAFRSPQLLGMPSAKALRLRRLISQTVARERRHYWAPSFKWPCLHNAGKISLGQALQHILVQGKLFSSKRNFLYYLHSGKRV